MFSMSGSVADTFSNAGVDLKVAATWRDAICSRTSAYHQRNGPTSAATIGRRMATSSGNHRLE
jgi:hypothetical protein